MKYVSATGDWYFIHPASETENNKSKANIFPVAVWAENDDGEMIGLIGNVESKEGSSPTKLISPPPLNGMYIKRNSANSELIDQALSNKHVDYFELREF